MPLSEEDGAQNGNVLFDIDPSENVPVKEGRVIKKAKRPSKLVNVNHEASPDGVSPPPVNGTKALLVNSKNSRRPRNLKGRGLPKKGGAGGKGVWGKPGSELVESITEEMDPNYDPDEEEQVVVINKVAPPLAEDDLQRVIQPILTEYLEHGQTDEVIDSLDEFNLDTVRQKIPVIAVSISLDRHDPQRELTSQLISDMYGRVVSQDDIAYGFDELLTTLSDLTLDCPNAPMLLGQFIARAVADDCLPPKFISSYKGQIENEPARVALDKADCLLNMKHGIVRLDNIWGCGGGNKPVKYLVKRMVLLLKEYLSSGDLAEATRCVKELDVPHFHHELVYEAIVMALEESTERSLTMMNELLKYLYGVNIITPEQMKQGMKRVFEDMPDICLDVPAAYTLLEHLGNKMYTVGILTEEIYKELPARGRKRFVSEGDGGRVKDLQLAL